MKRHLIALKQQLVVLAVGMIQLLCSAQSFSSTALVALTPSELGKPVRVPACRVEVKTDPEAQTVMLVLDGTTALAHFASLEPDDHHQGLKSGAVWLSMTGRIGSGAGHHVIDYGGSLPTNVDPLQFETYRIKLDVRKIDDCSSGASARCANYSGSVQVLYRPRAKDGSTLEFLAPPEKVKVHEECPAALYASSSMFYSPSWLDKISGWLLRSR